MKKLDYRLVRSQRKTFALEVTASGLVVRVPRQAAPEQIRQFLLQHEAWIEAHLQELARQKMQAMEQPALTGEDLRELTCRAKQVIPERVRYYADQIGVDYGRITIRCQKTRWGSCSAKGNLNFNCLLMLAPPQVLDSVVVHELCHRKEMNHSARFYAEVLRVFPDYRNCEKWLKEQGKLLFLRLNPR